MFEPLDHAARTSDLSWLSAFERERGRPLRVLHVGNVANNAYLNATFLRTAGVESDVLCHDYYDRMATPEWEATAGGRIPGRPRWFVQGPSSLCRRYLEAALDGRRLRAWALWQRLRLACWLRTPPLPRADGMQGPASQTARQTLLGGLHVVSATRRHTDTIRGKVVFARSYLSSLTRFLARKLLRLVGFDIREPPLAAPDPAAEAWRTELVARFREVFPDRPDQLTEREVWLWSGLADWKPLLDRYDIVQCYATHPITALIAGTRPFTAFEHGTLRDFTLGDDPLHRLNALAYRESDHVFITNGDCLAYAEALGITRFSPTLHPIDVDEHARSYGDWPERIRRELGGHVLLFCPLRHDWATKGTDVHLRALPTIVAEHERVVLALCAWGAQLGESRALLSDLGCAEYVAWLPPLTRRELIAHMKAADVVLDQIVLPHFGATAPQALACGTPVVMSYEPASTEWIVSEPAPILAAFDPEGVAGAVTTALDPEWRSRFADEARTWVHRHHHPRRMVEEQCRVYRRILEEAK